MPCMRRRLRHREWGACLRAPSRCTNCGACGNGGRGTPPDKRGARSLPGATALRMCRRLSMCRSLCLQMIWTCTTSRCTNCGPYAKCGFGTRPDNCGASSLSGVTALNMGVLVICCGAFCVETRSRRCCWGSVCPDHRSAWMPPALVACGTWRCLWEASSPSEEDSRCAKCTTPTQIVVWYTSDRAANLQHHCVPGGQRFV